MSALAIAALLLTASAVQADATRPLAAEIQEGMALRGRHAVQEQRSASTIYVHSISEHHLIEDYTRVATRGADGRWLVISIGEERPGLVGPPGGGTELIPEERRTLSPGESDHLDRLLHWRPLYGQASPQERDAEVGAYFHTMEIVTPQGHVVLRWTGRLRGWAGAVADLIMGKG